MSTDAERHPLDCLCKADIVELKSLHSPPRGVKDTLVALMAILGRRVSGANEWKNCRKNLGDPTFLGTLLNFDPKSVTSEDARYAKSLIADISPEVMMKQSKAASAVFTWVKAVLDMTS